MCHVRQGARHFHSGGARPHEHERQQVPVLARIFLGLGELEQFQDLVPHRQHIGDRLGYGASFAHSSCPK